MPPDHYFAATILGGHLHPNGIPEWGPWEASRLHWWPEDHLDLILPTTGDRKVRTSEELEAAIKEPMRVAPALRARENGHSSEPTPSNH